MSKLLGRRDDPQAVFGRRACEERVANPTPKSSQSLNPRSIMKKRFLSKKVVAVGVTAGLALGVAGGAFAFWTQGGSGTGSATTGDTDPITVNELVSASDLYPGGPAQPLSGDFDNPNPGVTHIGDVTAALGTLPAGCDESDFTIDNSGTTNSGTLTQGNGVGSWSGITIQMNETGLNQDACKTATIPLVYTLAAS
jgi:hypothetical protein